MIKLAFKLYAFISILSPWAFLIAKGLGIYNFKHDILVFIGLFSVSGITLFLTYNPLENESAYDKMLRLAHKNSDLDDKETN